MQFSSYPFQGVTLIAAGTESAALRFVGIRQALMSRLRTRESLKPKPKDPPKLVAEASWPCEWITERAASFGRGIGNELRLKLTA